MNDYCYYDAKDKTPYVPHTCTDADYEERESGASYRYKIVDGGDHTALSVRTLPIGALGSDYYDKQKHMNH